MIKRFLNWLKKFLNELYGDFYLMNKVDEINEILEDIKKENGYYR